MYLYAFHSSKTKKINIMNCTKPVLDPQMHSESSLYFLLKLATLVAIFAIFKINFLLQMTKLDHSNLVYFRPILLLLDMGNPLKSPLFRGIAKKLSPLLGLQKCKTSAFVTYLGNCISVLPTLNFYFANFFNFFPIFQKILIFFRKS